MITGTCHCGDASWSLGKTPDTATACNCTICRRYGALWAYGWLGQTIDIGGKTTKYLHGDEDIEFHHCARCGCVMWWQGRQPHPDGRTRVAVNLRMSARPIEVEGIHVHHFDGLDSWSSMPDDGRTVKDMWF